MLDAPKFKNFDWVKTTCTVYAGSQKDQQSNFKKFPPGTKGQIKHIGIDTEIFTWYCLIKIPVEQGEGKKTLYYWAKLNENVLEKYE